MFNIATPFVWTAWGDDDAPASRTLRTPYFEMGRSQMPDGDGASVEWQLTYGEWIRLFRTNGFIVEDLIELRPREGASTTYVGYAPYAWARDFPGEHIWRARRTAA